MLLKHIFYKSTARKSLLATIIVLGSLAGCTTPTQTTTTTGISPTNEQPDTLDRLLAAAEETQQLSPAARDVQLIHISKRLLAIGETAQASQLIQSIKSESLADDTYSFYTLTASSILLADQALYQARSVLSAERLLALLPQLPISQQQELHQVKARLYSQTGEVVAALNERVALGTLLSDTQAIKDNNDEIWQQLSQLTYDELSTLAGQAGDPVLSGWLSLAATSKQSQNTLESQSRAISSWVSQNPNHPASQQLPSDLALLQNLIKTKPKRIALLLPLQGKLAKAGQAIRDGFLASHFQHQTTHEDSPSIAFYDTSSNGDIQALYDIAISEGAELVIGPLEKQKVQALRAKAVMPVPVLALNYVDNTSELIDYSHGQKPFYQFGLSLEDEAVQVADRAWLEGHRQAMVIASKAKWSERATQAFIDRWQAKGGTLVASRQLDKPENYSSDIGSLLEIDKSHQRAGQLKRLFGRGFEFEPRRRADVDMIFLAARPQAGRQIKPTLNFHYASGVPVYATSQIYSSANSKEKNSDLNNVRLTTLPWILNQGIPEKDLLAENLTISPAYERLYALGVDSFLLYPRLEQLSQFSNQQLYGATGQLSIDDNKRVSRQQLWAEIKRGELKRLRELTLIEDF